MLRGVLADPVLDLLLLLVDDDDGAAACVLAACIVLTATRLIRVVF